MKIAISLVRAAVNAALDHAEQMSGGTIDVDEDLYWYINNKDIYAFERTPIELTIGSLADNLDAAQKVANGSRDPMGYDLVWLSNILRAIGERTY